MVATDHAPHAVEDKECEWEYARPGMLGLQTALSIVVRRRCLGDGLDWDGIAERMSRAPARIAGLADHGHDPAAGAPGEPDPGRPGRDWRVEPGELASKSRNTPYAGMELPARVVATFLRGVPTVLDGKLVSRSDRPRAGAALLVLEDGRTFHRRGVRQRRRDVRRGGVHHRR